MERKFGELIASGDAKFGRRCERQVRRYGQQVGQNGSQFRRTAHRIPPDDCRTPHGNEPPVRPKWISSSRNRTPKSKPSFAEMTQQLNTHKISIIKWVVSLTPGRHRHQRRGSRHRPGGNIPSLPEPAPPAGAATPRPQTPSRSRCRPASGSTAHRSSARAVRCSAAPAAAIQLRISEFPEFSRSRGRFRSVSPSPLAKRLNRGPIQLLVHHKVAQPARCDHPHPQVVLPRLHRLPHGAPELVAPLRRNLGWAGSRC